MERSPRPLSGRLPGSLLALLCALSPTFADAADCDCEQLRCLRGLIEQKTALAAGYDELAAKWSKLIKVDGVGVDEVDFTGVTGEADRAQFYRNMLTLHGVFAKQEDAMAAKVGPARDCGFSDGLSAETDTYETCKVDAPSLQRAQAESPCREIGELLGRHEDLHRRQCLIRRDAGTFWPYRVEGANGARAERYLPPRMQTPAGRAREEAAAYRMEVAALQKLVDRIEPKCAISFSGVTISCKMPGAEMGQDISGEVCGDPVTGTWTIRTVSWARPYGGRNVDPPWQSDCVAKGSAEERRREAIYRNSNRGGGGGWMCVYEEGESPAVIIRSFYPPPCSPSGEQKPVRVPARRSECGKPAPTVPGRDREPVEPRVPVS